MPSLYPLLLIPELRPRVWGTRDLRPIYDDTPDELIGESWLTGEDCKIANGSLRGMSLREVAALFGRDLVGDTAPREHEFPLLIKFLFPHEKLSVQVHPDDENARGLGLPCGKTECWYVLSAAPGAQVGLGLKPGVRKSDLEAAIRENRAEQLLNWIDLDPGDMIYVDAGTIHAIAPGSILVETQQNCDTTFRLYDYGRPRELHIEKGLAAMKERTRAGKVKRSDVHSEVLISSPCFEIRKLRSSLLFSEDSEERISHSIVAVAGSGILRAPGCDPVSFHCGEAIIVPADVAAFELTDAPDLEFLWARVPSGEVGQPETYLLAAAGSSI